MSNMESFDKVHEQLIEEEEINISDLPDGIKTKIRGWNLLFKKLENNPNDTKLYSSLQKQSVEIADKIQDFIETEFEEGEEEEEEEKPKGDEGKPKGDEGKPKSDEGKPKGDEPKGDEGKPKSDDGKPKGFGNLVMEKKILTKINESGDGRIRISDLEAIIGREPDYPEQKVHGIMLRKVFMSSDYRLV